MGFFKKMGKKLNPITRGKKVFKAAKKMVKPPRSGSDLEARARAAATMGTHGLV